ncbi:Rha family transcriptional regulator [Aquamicrobium ahrensii]|uniref:Rha family phage regulatory protein n=1 Tax=Aquamicrobium ahrensii TaxID=469551 RepID=A0ABV2KME0_9HYPH
MTIKDGKVFANSRDVADFFGKLHKDVLRAIDRLECSTTFYERNFAPMFVEVKIGNGARRKARAFDMTRYGFTLLAMGFTGKRALEFNLSAEV